MIIRKMVFTVGLLSDETKTKSCRGGELTLIETLLTLQRSRKIHQLTAGNLAFSWKFIGISCILFDETMRCGGQNHACFCLKPSMDLQELL